MQATQLSSVGLKKQYKIVVESAKIQAQTEVELKAAGEQVKIPGFRPGFIPMKVLQQRYGKAVQADVLKQVINQSTTDLITQKQYRPTLTPEVNIESYEEGGDLTFTISFEVFPDIGDLDFSQIKLNRKVFEIGEKDLEKTLDSIAERNPSLVPVEDAKAELGNVLTIDFTGSVAGVEFKGGSAKNFNLELGSNQFIDGFEAQLVGTKVSDERVVKVTFPVDYPAADLAGKEADFAVKVHAIQAKEPAKIDDEFAKDKGFADAAAFKEAVRAQMAKEYDYLVRNHLKKELFDILESEHQLELPEAMVEMEFKTIWQRLQEARKEGDESLAGKSDEQLKEEYMGIAKRRVKLGLLLAEVGNRNKIQISREEMTRAIMQQASQYPGQESKVIEFYRKNPERADELRGPILEEKAVDFILSKVTFADQKVTLEELADEGDDDAEAAPKAKSGKAKSAKKSDDENDSGDADKKASGKKKASK